MSPSEIFKLAKTVNMRDYLERFGLEFDRSNKCRCPFHDESTPSFSVKELKVGWHFECFGCGAKGDSTKFVELYHRIGSLEAAKTVCRDNGIEVDEPEDEQKKAKREAEIAERLQAEKERREAAAKAALATDAALLDRLTLKGETLYENSFDQRDAIKKHFPLWGAKLDAWGVSYLGWDATHQSIAIIIRDLDNRVRNIKTREKWVWDKDHQQHIVGERNPALKWGGEHNARVYPFPMQYFHEHNDETVIVCEGEKDALNLLNLNVRCLTIGSAGGDFEPWADLLKGKRVLIWFDHDAPGYTGALKHYAAIADIAMETKIVSFSHLCNPPKKYDISDYLEQYNITSKDELFDRIAYATFTPTNRLIDYICELFPSKNLKSTLDKYKKNDTIDIDTVLRDVISNTTRVRGEADSELNRLESVLNHLKKEGVTKNFAAFIGDGGDVLVESLEDALKKKQTLYTNYRQTHEVDIANAFLRVCKEIGYPIISYHGHLFIWIGTHYYRFKETELIDFVMHRWFYQAKVDVKKQTADMMDKMIKNLLYKSPSLEPIRDKQDYNVITFANGTFLVFENGRTLFKRIHQIEDGSTFAMPWDYNPNARAPKWQKFLSRVLPQAEERDALMEFFGYCFLPSHRFQKFLLMYGKSGSNGKSVVMEVIRMFFGREMIGDLDLQDTEGHQLEALDGKMINIGSEIDASSMEKGGQFGKLKKMTSGESVTVDPKHRSPYSIDGAQIPKFIYSANVRPKSGLDAGVFRRMLLLGFTQQISGGEVILDIHKRFEDEMDGIFNLAIEGLARLIANNGFTQSDVMRENIEDYKKEANPLLSYISENVKKDSRSCVPVDFLFEHYKLWCDKNGHHKISRNRFSREIREELDIQVTKMRFNHAILKKREPVFAFGIVLSPSEMDMVKIDGQEIVANTMNIDPINKVPIMFE